MVLTVISLVASSMIKGIKSGSLSKSTDNYNHMNHIQSKHYQKKAVISSRWIGLNMTHFQNSLGLWQLLNDQRRSYIGRAMWAIAVDPAVSSRRVEGDSVESDFGRNRMWMNRAHIIATKTLTGAKRKGWGHDPYTNGYFGYSPFSLGFGTCQDFESG